MFYRAFKDTYDFIKVCWLENPEREEALKSAMKKK